jgi:hypothetical protein
MDRALIVGISDYGRLGQPLPGCINDMNEWRGLLVGALGFAADEVRLLADDRATKPEIEKRLDWLLADGAKGGRRVFVFAGHGARLRRRDSDTGDLDDKRDEALVTYPPPAGDADTYLIYDDDLAAIADKSGAGPSCRVTFIFDSCHSGGMLRAMFDLNGEKPLPRCWLKPPDLAARSATVPLPVRRLGSFEGSRSNVPRLIIAAAREEESAWDALMDDGERHGAFTYHATRALARENALSADALINHVSPLVAVRFPQHPGLLGDEARYGRPIFEARKQK